MAANRDVNRFFQRTKFLERTKNFLCMMVSLRKTNDGQTTWIVERTKKLQFFKNELEKTWVLLNKLFFFLQTFYKTDVFYLNNEFI